MKQWITDDKLPVKLSEDYKFSFWNCANRLWLCDIAVIWHEQIVFRMLWLHFAVWNFSQTPHSIILKSSVGTGQNDIAKKYWKLPL